MNRHPERGLAGLLASTLLAKTLFMGAALAEAVPAPTPADRAAAFPDLGHHAMDGHMDDDAL